MIRLIWVLLIGVAKVFRGSPSTPFQVDELKLVYMCIISKQTKCLGAITSSQQDVTHFGICWQFWGILAILSTIATCSLRWTFFDNHQRFFLECISEHICTEILNII